MRLFNSGKVKYNPRGKVLEIACGFAPAPESSVCLDSNPERIKKIRKEKQIGILGDALNLPFKNKRFNHITCMHLAEHFEADELKKIV